MAETGRGFSPQYHWCNDCANYVKNDPVCFGCDGTDANHANYERQPRATNADRIRAMSDEELAWFYAKKIALCYGCESSTMEDCAKCWLDWLRKEAKYDTDE